jgi:hypothetical protein
MSKQLSGFQEVDLLTRVRLPRAGPSKRNDNLLCRHTFALFIHSTLHIVQTVSRNEGIGLSLEGATL